MRHLALIAVLATLVAGCGAAGPSPSAMPSAAPTATTATPSATPTPTQPPKAVAGWPTVRQGAVTMTGQYVEDDTSGFPVVEVTLTGLAPGEAVPLSGTGIYRQVLKCGPLPSGCPGGDISEECSPVYAEEFRGLLNVPARPTADAAGTAAATLRFEVTEASTKACPAGGGMGWLGWSGEWKVAVADPAHGLTLVADEYIRGP